MSKAQTQPHLKHFSKYDFVEKYIATSSVSDQKLKEEKKKEAAIIADAIEETQAVLLENLATKEDLAILKKDLIITLTAIMASLLTFLPLVTEFLKKLF